LGVANSAARGAFLSIAGNAAAHISGANLVHNWVKPDGVGALVSARGSSFVSMTDCQAVGGVLQPEVYGGACYLEANASLDLARCTLSNYHASRGAGVATFENSRVRGRDCALINMTATIDGGGLLIASSADNSWLNCLLNREVLAHFSADRRRHSGHPWWEHTPFGRAF
jgi:hypothetical protein